MRKLKFRAWDDKNTKWTTLISAYTNEDQTVTLNIKENEDLIVEQYTGLKDKNGKEIYEGDIVRDYDEGYLYSVDFVEYHAQFMFYDFVNDDYYNNQDIAEHEIIGNIHENKELLK